MIHKGKAYKEVLDGSAEVGDLVHVTKLHNVPLDFYALITRFDTEGDKRLDSLLPNNTDFLIDDDDTDFKVYRHVKEEEETLTEHNVKEGEYFVITDKNNGSQFKIGEVVKVLAYYSSVAFTASNTDNTEHWQVRYTDVRRATEDEISGTTKTKVEEANTIYTDVMVELELLANSKEDTQKRLDNRIQEIKEEQEQLRQRNNKLDTVRRVLEAL